MLNEGKTRDTRDTKNLHLRGSVVLDRSGGSMSEQAGSTSNGSKMVGPREVVVHGNSRGRMDLGRRTAGLLGYEQGRSART